MASVLFGIKDKKMKLKHKITGNIIVGSQNFLDTNSNEYEESLEVVPTFAENVIAKHQELNARFTNAIEEQNSKYTYWEIKTFERKSNEALDFRDNPTTHGNGYVNGMGKGNQAARESLFAAILAKVDYMSDLEGDLLINRELIEAATTQAELDAIMI